MKLAEALKISQTVPDSSAEKFQVFLACGIFPLHLSTFLAAHLTIRLPERAVEIQTGIYDDLPGNLSRAQKSSAHAVAVVVEWSDLDPRLGLRRLGGWGPGVLPDIQTSVQQSAARLLQLLAATAQSAPLALCLPTIPLPPISYQPSAQFPLDSLLLEKTLYDFALSATELPQVKIVSRQRLDAMSPLSERLDVKSELSTGFPYRTAHAAKVAELLGELIQPRPPKKGLITDLDDTLWRGLLGEEGVAGISWELDRRSHIHALYQQLLGALAESGVLVGVASKNDHNLALEALARQDLLVSKDQLFPLEINWEQKSNSVARILQAWNIGPDALVFVDDSSMELAEVKSVYPQMECLLFPKDDDNAAYQLMVNLRDLFGKQAILEEDAIRVESLRHMSQFHSQVQNAPERSLTDFLKGVEAQLAIGPVDAAGEERAFELIEKTNQFNLNGRRLSKADFAAALRRPGAISLLVSYRDKFGPLGKIAVLLGVNDSNVIKIDTWVMSCRAFSRHIEHECINYLFEKWDVTRIDLDYQATARNGPVSDFLQPFADLESNSFSRIDRETFMNRRPELFHNLNNNHA